MVPCHLMYLCKWVSMRLLLLLPLLVLLKGLQLLGIQLLLQRNLWTEPWQRNTQLACCSGGKVRVKVKERMKVKVWLRMKLKVKIKVKVIVNV